VSPLISFTTISTVMLMIIVTRIPITNVGSVGCGVESAGQTVV
jgi:hypothetical protein